MTLAEKPTDEPKTVPSMVREPKFRVKYDANKGPQTDNNTVSSGADESVNSAGEPEINLGSIIDCSDCGARRTTIVVVDNHLCCEGLPFFKQKKYGKIVYTDHARKQFVSKSERKRIAKRKAKRNNNKKKN